MNLLNFETESWMTLHENNCLYNLADSCAKALTFQELYDLIEDKETFHHHLMDMMQEVLLHLHFYSLLQI